MTLEKRQLCFFLLTRDGLWAKVNSEGVPEDEKTEARKALCDYFFAEEPEETKKESDKSSSESPPGTRKRKGATGASSSTARWLARRSPEPDSGAESGSAVKRRTR